MSEFFNFHTCNKMSSILRGFRDIAEIAAGSRVLLFDLDVNIGYALDHIADLEKGDREFFIVHGHFDAVQVDTLNITNYLQLLHRRAREWGDEWMGFGFIERTQTGLLFEGYAFDGDDD